MSFQAHHAELERRHQALQEKIYKSQRHPSCDDLKITELKRRKFFVKDELTRLPQ
jgi:hypothetical protein